MDRRIARTRRALRDALVELVIERGWDAVGVRDLCARADVGRSTFYAHFGDKEHVLVSGLDELRDVLRAVHPVGQPRLGFVEWLAAHAAEHRPLFRAIVGRRSGALVQARFRALVGELVAEDLPDDPVAAEFIAGGLFALLGAWVDRGATSPSALAREVERLVAPLLGHAAVAPLRAAR